MKPVIVVICLSIFFGVANAEKPSKLPVEYFARLPMFSKPQISPDGRRVAVSLIMGGERKVVMLKLMTPDDPEKEETIPISMGDKHFSWYRWANNDRLIAGIRSTYKLPRVVPGTGIRLNVDSDDRLINLTRLVAVNRDGTGFLAFKMSANSWGLLNPRARVVSMLDKDPEHILAVLDLSKKSNSSSELDLVNINSGEKKRVMQNNRNMSRWIADSNGVVRVSMRYDAGFKNTKAKIWYREDANSKWEILQVAKLGGHKRMVPYRFDEDDPNILLVSSVELREVNREKEGKHKIFKYDLTKREVIGPYVDTHRKKVKKLLSKVIPDAKITIASRSKDKMRYIVRVSSDTISPTYYLFDLKTKHVALVGAEYPDLIGKSLAKMQKVTYKARDDLEIPAFLSIPHGAEEKNLPTIIFPHGGPTSRDRKRFNNYVQFFANRGYAVFQPQFRGSTGQGIKHQEVGYGQWGRAMQDDITDGVQWLIDEGIADPDKICIVGGSYGGYTASMALAKTPDLFQCAVSINGVHDLKRLIDKTKYSLFVKLPERILSDPKQAKKYSPYHLVKNINKPMLLIAGESDTVVPIVHSEKMYKKLKKQGVPVEFIELEKGEHWHTNEKNEIIKFRAMDEFLAKYL